MVKLLSSAKGFLSVLIVLISAWLSHNGHLDSGHFAAIIATVATIFHITHTTTDLFHKDDKAIT